MAFFDQVTRIFQWVGGSQTVFTVKPPYIFQMGDTNYTNTAFVLPNNTSLNAMFPAARDTFTAAGGTTYQFVLNARLTTGATSHTVAFSLLGAGTATLTSVNLTAVSTAAADQTLAASQQTSIVVGTAVVVIAATTAVKQTLNITGTFTVNAGGTIIPSIQFSADPTGTLQVDAGSYVSITPLGTGAYAGSPGWS